jgi:DNA primase
VRTTGLTEVERVLLRALAIIDPDHQQARKIAADAILQQPAWFEQLGVFTALKVLADRQARDPMDVVEDPAQRALLAEALLGEVNAPSEELVASTLAGHETRLIEQEMRSIRQQMAEAERKGDYREALKFGQRKIALDRRLSELKNGSDSQK